MRAWGRGIPARQIGPRGVSDWQTRVRVPPCAICKIVLGFFFSYAMRGVPTFSLITYSPRWIECHWQTRVRAPPRACCFFSHTGVHILMTKTGRLPPIRSASNILRVALNGAQKPERTVMGAVSVCDRLGDSEGRHEKGGAVSTASRVSRRCCERKEDGIKI